MLELTGGCDDMELRLWILDIINTFSKGRASAGRQAKVNLL